ncbi:MAG: hypothetical protein E7638_07025, partial [Ruminococcaceae bacterium]|nr:hypothetical protein [Oscillospiraceae bacterium]
MKKKLFTLLLSAMCVAGLAVTANADATLMEEREIPRATIAPTIDGEITGNEWEGALVIEINHDNTDEIYGDFFTTRCPDTTVRWMWDDAGLYVFAEVNDTTKPTIVHNPNTGHYNSGDGIQFCMYPNVEDIGETEGMLYFWSLVINTAGEAEVGEHFVYGRGGSYGNDVEAVIADCTKSDDKYTIEAFFPADV